MVSEKLFCTQFDGIELLPGRLNFYSLAGVNTEMWKTFHVSSLSSEREHLDGDVLGWRDSTVVGSRCCSCRRPKFGFQHLCQWFLVSLAWVETYIYVYTHIGMHTQLQINFKVSSAWCGGIHL